MAEEKVIPVVEDVKVEALVPKIRAYKKGGMSPEEKVEMARNNARRYNERKRLLRNPETPPEVIESLIPKKLSLEVRKEHKRIAAARYYQELKSARDHYRGLQHIA